MKRIATMAALCAAATLPAWGDVVKLKSGGRLEGLARRNGEVVTVETATGEISFAGDEVESIDTAHTSPVELYYQKLDGLKSSTDPVAFLELAAWTREQGMSRLAPLALQKAAPLVKADQASPVIRRAVALGLGADARTLLKRALFLTSEVRDVPSLADLAALAASLGLADEAHALHGKVVALAPDHEGARRALGFRLHQGRWLNNDEWHAALGHILFEGAWMTTEERDFRLREKAAGLESRRRALDEGWERLEADRRGIQESREQAAALREDAASLWAQAAALRNELAAQREELSRKTAQADEALRRAEELRTRHQRHTLCAACGAWHRDGHICPDSHSYCGTCCGYFARPHACRR